MPHAAHPYRSSHATPASKRLEAPSFANGIMTTVTMMLRALAALLGVAALCMSAACGSTPSDSAHDASKPITERTLKPGTLTIATGDPAYEPWMLDNKPESGKGYESALAYAVAEQLGFPKDKVTWVRTTFDAAIAPGVKDFDMNIQQFSITPERKKVVDFSPSYFNATKSIVVRKDSSYAHAAAASDFKNAAVGATVGTTGYEIAKRAIKQDIQTFNDDASLAQALQANQLDAIVVDTPTAVEMMKGKQVSNAQVLGQIPDSTDAEGLGIVLPKDSALTAAVSQAIEKLTSNGTIARLQQQWLAEYTSDVPTLKR